MRTYELVWKELKVKQEVKIKVAHEFFVKRIKRMISKEKDIDIGFKLMNDIERFYLRYEWDQAQMELCIRLQSRFGLTDIVR